MKKVDILKQAQSEFEQSRKVVETKRKIFRDRLKLFKEDTKQKNKVSVNLCYSNIRGLMALSYSDELIVDFVGREFSDDEQASILTKTAEFDKEEMGMDEINL